MTRRATLTRAAAAAAAAALLALPAHPADDPSLSKDLTSTIALLGLPCGKVVKSERRGSNDYVATCQDGNRYRVTLNPNGRVVAKKL
jgi:hypothetical protein